MIFEPSIYFNLIFIFIYFYFLILDFILYQCCVLELLPDEPPSAKQTVEMFFKLYLLLFLTCIKFELKIAKILEKTAQFARRISEHTVDWETPQYDMKSKIFTLLKGFITNLVHQKYNKSLHNAKKSKLNQNLVLVLFLNIGTRNKSAPGSQ